MSRIALTRQSVMWDTCWVGVFWILQYIFCLSCTITYGAVRLTSNILALIFSSESKGRMVLQALWLGTKKFQYLSPMTYRYVDLCIILQGGVMCPSLCCIFWLGWAHVSFVYRWPKAVYILILYNPIWYILKEASRGYLVEKCAVRDQHLAWLTTYSVRQGTRAKLLFLDQWRYLHQPPRREKRSMIFASRPQREPVERKKKRRTQLF